MADTARPGNDIVNVFIELSPEYQTSDGPKFEQKVIDYCRENMTPYKVPKKVHFIDSIPLTAIGKIDKKVLRDQLASAV